MGISTRVFRVGEGGELVRMPYARFVRLWAGRGGESLAPDEIPSDDGKAQLALAYVELHSRKPVRLVHVDFLRIAIDERGRFDQAAMERGLRLAVASMDIPLGPELVPTEASNVVHAEHRFYRAQYRGEFMWEPSVGQIGELYRLALG